MSMEACLVNGENIRYWDALFDDNTSRNWGLFTLRHRAY